MQNLTIGPVITAPNPHIWDIFADVPCLATLPHGSKETPPVSGFKYNYTAHAGMVLANIWKQGVQIEVS